MRLPDAAPNFTFDANPGDGRVKRACRPCESFWWGLEDDVCWLCAGPAETKPHMFWLWRQPQPPTH